MLWLEGKKEAKKQLIFAPFLYPFLKMQKAKIGGFDRVKQK